MIRCPLCMAQIRPLAQLPRFHKRSWTLDRLIARVTFTDRHALAEHLVTEHGWARRQKGRQAA